MSAGARCDRRLTLARMLQIHTAEIDLVGVGDLDGYVVIAVRDSSVYRLTNYKISSLHFVL